MAGARPAERGCPRADSAAILIAIADEEELHQAPKEEQRPIGEMLQEGRSLQLTANFAITPQEGDPDPHGTGIRPDPEPPPALPEAPAASNNTTEE